MIELIVALVIVGVIAAFGMPQMRTFILNNRITSATNDLVGDLYLARSEAVTRHTNVGLCLGTQCAEVAANGTAAAAATDTWADARSVFVDAANAGIYQAADPVLRQTDALPGGTTMTLSVAGNPSNLAVLLFNSQGLLVVPNNQAGAVAAQFQACDARTPCSQYGQSICISPTGQVQAIPAAQSCP